MPAKNSIKVYSENSYYHIYNRGVEKRNIFLDDQDYSVFLSYLQTYLSPKDSDSLKAIVSSSNSSSKEKDRALKLLHLKNYSPELDLVCYALLPNHFHLLIRQQTNCIDRFMNSLGIRYAMYFNRKYRRTGTLFQDVYKAVLVTSEEQLLHLSRYIHLNPSKLSGHPPSKWQLSPYPSSIPEFLGLRRSTWIKPHHILDYFSTTNPKLTYENFLGASQDNTFIFPYLLDP